MDVDLFSDESLMDPYENYRMLRNAGETVYLEDSNLWVAARYDFARFVLHRHDLFSSAAGVGFDDELNQLRKGTVLASDPPDHTRLRLVLAGSLAPGRMRHLRADIERQADELVREMVDRGGFDGVIDFAMRFPVSIVADLIGLPSEGRDKLLFWADAAFNTFGPRNERTLSSLAGFVELRQYMGEVADKLTPGSMGRIVYEAVERGEIAPEHALPLMAAYLTAGMDTTVNSISNALWLFGSHPDQWNLLRSGEVSIPMAYNESLRFESPVYAFSRHTTKDVDVAGHVVPRGARVAVLYGSANRDELKWTDPDTFDLNRKPADHLAFGFGVHGCAGQGLARLEVHAVLQALVNRVERIEVARPVRRLNNVIRGLANLDVTLVPAGKDRE
jgi:cytochrome P450